MNIKTRRIINAIIIIVSLLLLSSVFAFWGRPRRMNSLYLSETDIATLKSERNLDDSLDISGLRVNSYALASSGNNLYYSIVENDKNALNPILGIESTYNVVVTGKLLSYENIENNVPVSVLVYSDTAYRELNLYATTLPVLVINFENGVPETRMNDLFEMTLFDNREGVHNRIVTSDGKAHKRGGVSFGAPKSNLAIDLFATSIDGNKHDNEISILGMQERSEYVLAGMYYDYEKVRDMFGATFWREASGKRNEFGLDLSNDWRYVEVVANGDYYGLYMLGYKPDETVFDINTEGDHPDILFKAAEGEDFGNFILGKTTVLSNYELISDTDKIYSYNILREYVRAMYGSDPEKALEWSDYDNAVDFWLFTDITQNDDIPRDWGMYKNTYIALKWNGEYYKALFIPWDHDIGMGSCSPSNSFYTRSPDQSVYLSTDLVSIYQRASDKDMKEAVWNRYFQLRGGFLNFSNIDRYLDSLEAQIFGSGAFRRNMERWPESNSIDPTLKLSKFKEFIHQRLTYMNTDLFSENQLNYRYEIPNYITVYLKTGEILSEDDPEYLVAAPEEENYDELYEDYTSAGF